MTTNPMHEQAPVETVRVLHVDDDDSLAEVTAIHLTNEDDRFEIETATSATAGLRQLANADHEFDCVVSDYDMAGTNGIEFLRAVRGLYPDLPFILFTGKGSEEVASEAISEGVTDYLQKETGTGHYPLLANRVLNAVEQHRARRALQDSEKRLSLFFEQSPLGVIEWNQEFEVVRLNAAGEEIFGYTEEELTGESWETLVTSNSYDSVDAVTDALLEVRGGFHSIDENVRKDGEVITVEWHNRVVTDEAGDVVAIFSQCQDITARRERERDLETTQRRLDAILENTTTPMFMKDREGRYIFVNQGHHELFGFEDAEIVGHTDHELFPEAMADEVWANDRQVLDRGEPVEIEEDVIVDGEERTFMSTKVPIYDTGEEHDDERPVAVFGVATDITKLKRREAELQRERDRLDEFASIVSHDLRNPLTVARGRLELARETCANDHLDAVAQAHDRMGALIDDLLTLARQGGAPTAVETVDLCEVVDDCWATVVTENATLRTEIDRTIEADRGRLRQLFENLFRNSVEHAGPDVAVTVGSLPNGFYVEDDGPGIPLDQRDRVMEPGYSTSDSGTGFGLSIVAEIAETNGWALSITESDAGGARFEFTELQ